ncbi:MAG: hypothetical protein LBC61_06520 [Candidatus Peribacteria bacterium]|nr:hypothetical protein [Candidatus Peribacteria bacterium]
MSLASILAIFGSTQVFASQSVSKIITFSLFSFFFCSMLSAFASNKVSAIIIASQTAVQARAL